MKYEITQKDSECTPMVPGNSKLEIGDIVSVTNMKNNTTHTFIVVEVDPTVLDICVECDSYIVGGCICHCTGDNRYATDCAAFGRSVFRSMDKIMENL